MAKDYAGYYAEQEIQIKKQTLMCGIFGIIDNQDQFLKQKGLRTLADQHYRVLMMRFCY